MERTASHIPDAKRYAKGTRLSSAVPQALKFVAEQSGIRPTALAKVLGTTHAMASLMLAGKRGISAQAARKLAAHFRVDAGLFI